MSVAVLLNPTTHDIVQHRHSVQLRNSSEDTALNIFSMYSSGRSTSIDSDRPLSYVMESSHNFQDDDHNIVISTPTQHMQLQDQLPYSTHSETHQSLSQPAPGEDADSFHVRSTYAQLEVQGVPGDGFQDGMELTRTRSNAVRTKIDPSFRTSPEDELRFLSMVDRYGFYLPPTSNIDRIAVLPAASLAKRLSPVPSPSKSHPKTPLKGGARLKANASQSPITRSLSPTPLTLAVPNTLRARSRSASPSASPSLHSRSQSLSTSQPPTPSSAKPPPPRHEFSRQSKWYRMLIPVPGPTGSRAGSYPQPHSLSSSGSRSESPSTSTEPHSHSHSHGQVSGPMLSTPIYGGGNVLYWTIHPRKVHKFRERVFKGVPDAWRAAAWGVMLESFGGVQRQRFEALEQDYAVRSFFLCSFFSSNI